MKGILLCILAVVAMNTGVKAQIQLMGAAVNMGTGKIDLIQWQPLDSSSVAVTPTILDGYYFGSSAFDAFNSNYYLTGISGMNTGLYSFNSTTNEESLAEGSSFSNISEFDMSTGKMYNLIMETEENISIYAFDINSNEDSLIGIIYEPGANGIVADAIGFDSNNGIMYYVGFTNDPALCLYAIPVRDSVFSYTKTILTTTAPYHNITCVNYDNINEKIYALSDTYDSLFNFTGRNIVEINKITGEIINRGDLTAFPYYVGGSSCFDQYTSTFLLAAIDTNSALKMVAFNTLTDTYVSGFIPALVSEIVCDNSTFAKYTYSSTGIVEEPAFSSALYPNPVSETLSILLTASGPVNVQIFSSDGKLVLSPNSNYTNKFDLDLQSLSPGLYIVNLISKDQIVSKRIIVQ